MVLEAAGAVLTVGSSITTMNKFNQVKLVKIREKLYSKALRYNYFW